MKRAIVILSLLLLSGCILRTEQTGDCGSRANCVIRFTLPDAVCGDIFAQEISCIELFVYDAHGTTVVHSQIPKSELERFAGKRLQLPAGNYSAVAWGNAMRSRIVDDHDGDPMDRTGTRVTTAVPLADGTLDDGDPLYYAPKECCPLNFTVPERGSMEIVAEMRHAHVKLEVAVEGYENVLTRAAEGVEPHIEVTDLVSSYDFGMRGFGDAVSYAGHTKAGETNYVRQFNIPVFDRNSPTRIVVSDHGRTQKHRSLRMVEMIDPEVNLDTLRRLPVVVRFFPDGSVDVSVNLPRWTDNPVEPEL